MFKPKNKQAGKKIKVHSLSPRKRKMTIIPTFFPHDLNVDEVIVRYNSLKSILDKNNDAMKWLHFRLRKYIVN
jgi:hypothetical protein